MTRRVPALFLFLVATASTAHAQSGVLEWSASASVVQRKLVERTPSGSPLVTEEGPMGRLGLRVGSPLANGGALAGRLSLTGGDLDYDGQMQLTGTPLVSTTRHLESEADIAWRPLAPAAWGEGWLSLGWLDNRRSIRATAVTRPLYERSSALMAGAMWRSPAIGALRGWDLVVEAEARGSLRHRVHVDFYGLLAPNRLTLPGGDKTLFKLRLLAAAPTSPWEWAIEWSRLSQEVSGSVPARGFGLPLTVSQPELTIRDVSLRLARRF